MMNWPGDLRQGLEIDPINLRASHVAGTESYYSLLPDFTVFQNRRYRKELVMKDQATTMFYLAVSYWCFALVPPRRQMEYWILDAHQHAYTWT